MELNNGETPNPQTPQTQNPHHSFYENDDLYDFSNCSTPYVSAPSSPGRAAAAGPTISGFFYSAPASPMHLLMTSSSTHLAAQIMEASAAEFEFSARFGSTGSGPTGPMSSAEELFLDGKIRPMKLSTHLEQPQPGLIDPENEGGRDPRVLRSRRTRSMSPMRTMSLVSEIYSADHNNSNNAELGKNDEDDNDDSEQKKEELSGGGGSGASSRSSSAGRNSKRWVFLKEFLHRSKSEGQQRSNANISKLLGTNLFSGSGKETANKAHKESLNLGAKSSNVGAKKGTGKAANGVMGKRRNAPSLHELHYTANRAQSEEMRKKTYLPYRQGLLGCLGFSSKGYGAAMNTGFARALNPVSSR